MAESLYGARGFYVTASTPRRHFRTAAHAGTEWPNAIARLARLVHEEMDGPADFQIVDVGAGGGELLRGLAGLVPTEWQLVGVDVAPRPANLPTRVRWAAEPPDSVTGLMLASELLDVVPVEVVQLAADGMRFVEVRTDGTERLGALVSGADLDWIHRWWRPREIGDRAEVGRWRDAVWRGLTSRLDAGLAVAIDYAVDSARDTAGTMTAFRCGRQVRPVPDGSCDLTTRVYLESLMQSEDRLLTQREAMTGLIGWPQAPTYGGDPAAYLAGLAAVGAATELVEASGLGDFRWLLHPVGIPSPI